MLRPRINYPVAVELKASSTTVHKVDCQMIAKGVIVATRTIELVNQTANFSFVPSILFAPSTQMVFFYLSTFSVIESTAVNLTLNENLPNFV